MSNSRQLANIARKGVIVVDTVADLRAHPFANSPELVFETLGAVAAGDGGGGTWYWNAGSTVDQDDYGAPAAGTVLELAGIAGRRVRVVKDSNSFHTAWWFGEGDNTTDRAVELQEIVRACYARRVDITDKFEFVFDSDIVLNNTVSFNTPNPVANQSPLVWENILIRGDKSHAVWRTDRATDLEKSCITITGKYVEVCDMRFLSSVSAGTTDCLAAITGFVFEGYYHDNFFDGYADAIATTAKIWMPNKGVSLPFEGSEIKLINNIAINCRGYCKPGKPCSGATRASPTVFNPRGHRLIVTGNYVHADEATVGTELFQGIKMEGYPSEPNSTVSDQKLGSIFNNNIVIGPFFEGVYTEGDATVVSNNVVFGASRGIKPNGYGSMCSNNIICAQNAIEAYSLSEGIISNNICVPLPTHLQYGSTAGMGIYVGAKSGRILITGNSITPYTADTMRFTLSAALAIGGNIKNVTDGMRALDNNSISGTELIVSSPRSRWFIGDQVTDSTTTATITAYANTINMFDGVFNNGIRTVDAGYCTITNNFINGGVVSNGGISLDGTGSAAGQEPWNHQVIGNIIEGRDTLPKGISLGTGKNSGCWNTIIQNNSIRNVKQQGIDISAGSQNVKIINNTISGTVGVNTATLINAAGNCHKITIINNVLSGAGSRGIALSNSNEMVIVGNTIYDTTSQAFYSYQGRMKVFKNNTAWNNNAGAGPWYFQGTNWDDVVEHFGNTGTGVGALTVVDTSVSPAVRRTIDVPATIAANAPVTWK